MDYHPSTHPPLPPTTEDDRLTWLRLLRSRRVGITTFYRLLHEHGTARIALEALPEVAAEAGVQGYAPCDEDTALREMRAARTAGARMIVVGTPDYPGALLDVADPPPFLWAMGDIAALHRPMIAVVGARNASSLGLRMARSIARDLSAEGFVVVSGLARGIDAAAHEAALEGGTVAVVAGGVDVPYPAETARLGDDLLRKGARISEMRMGQQPQARHFPRRNRLVSGLARALVVVEAAAKSGSLITARTALDQGRDVLAVPGHPFDARAAGSNMLIRDGAVLIRSAADVIEALPQAAGAEDDAPVSAPELPLARPPDKRSLRDTAALHRQILDRLGPSPLAEDQLIRDLNRAAHLVAPAITQLEFEGRVRRQAGGLLSRTGTG